MARPSENIEYDVSSLKEEEPDHDDFDTWHLHRKNSCSVVGVENKGAVIVRRTMRRQTFIEFVSKVPACIIAMEACCGAHHLGRLFAAPGHVCLSAEL